MNDKYKVSVFYSTNEITENVFDTYTEALAFAQYHVGVEVDLYEDSSLPGYLALLRGRVGGFVYAFAEITVSS